MERVRPKNRFALTNSPAMHDAQTCLLVFHSAQTPWAFRRCQGPSGELIDFLTTCEGTGFDLSREFLAVANCITMTDCSLGRSSDSF
jgi:hypothetical protein